MYLYDYIFFKIYESIGRINKIRPEMYAISYLTILLSINLFTSLIFLGILTNQIIVLFLIICSIFIFTINNNIFLKNNKYIHIVNNFKKAKRSWFIDKLVYLYPQISFMLFSMSLDFDFLDIIILLVGVSIVDIVFYFKNINNS
jgi:hypothetical protein